LDKQRAFKNLFESAKAIVFDFDGVLADSEKYHFLTYSEVFARYGHVVDETEYYKYWTSLGHGAKGEIERHDLDLDPLAIREEKLPLFSEYCRNGSIKLYDEVAEILDCLSKTGKTLTIASGTASYDIEAILQNAGELDKFMAIIGSDTVPAIKPAPDLFLAMLERLDLEPSECLVIEDAEKGMQASIAAGIPVIIIRTNETKTIDFSSADLVLDSHAELLDLLIVTFQK
jgi:HAD superfamily hydrolase (TIGR01509 family)